MADKIYESKNIKFCNDGKYRWVYELDMLSNSAILKECYRVFLIICAIVTVIAFFMNLGNGFFEAITDALTIGAIVTGIFMVLGLIAYLIVSFMYSGKYFVLFELDEKGLMHAQQEKHVKKAHLIGAITALTGAARGNIGAIGTGILATRTEMYSNFTGIKVIEVVPESNLIRLNATLDRNQVYAEKEDLAFVLQYIVQQCPQAKLKGDYKAYLK